MASIWYLPFALSSFQASALSSSRLQLTARPRHWQLSPTRIHPRRSELSSARSIHRPPLALARLPITALYGGSRVLIQSDAVYLYARQSLDVRWDGRMNICPRHSNKSYAQHQQQSIMGALNTHAATSRNDSSLQTTRCRLGICLYILAGKPFGKLLMQRRIFIRFGEGGTRRSRYFRCSLQSTV